MSSVAQPVWVVDERGDIIFANPAALDALGYETADDLLGRPSHATIHHHHPDGSVYPASECPMLRPRETGETISVEQDWFFRADGSMFPVSYRSTPIELTTGRGAVVAFTDIEDRLRVEEVLRERDTILETLDQPVFVADEQGIVRYVNPCAVEALGFDDASEIVGQNGHWLVHYKRPDGSPLPIEECELTQAREQGDPAQTGEDWFVRKDGSMVRLAYTVAPIRTASGLGSVIAFNDIEDRRRAEEAARERDLARARADALQASEERIRSTLEAALDCVVSMDADGIVTYFNPAAERTFGIDAGDAIGREMAEVVIPPSLRAAHRAGLARYLATGEARVLDRRIEITGMRSDGSEFPVELAVTRAGVDGEASFTAYIRDITDKKLSEQELRDARRRAIEAADAERRRVTRDLHDGAQQDLVNVVVNLQLARQTTSDADQVHAAMSAASTAADRGLDSLRQLAAGMHPALLSNRGLGAAVRSLAKRVTLPVEVIEMPNERLPAEMEASLYFFISEALTNVVKHARAKRASVAVCLDGSLLVRIEDDGVGGVTSDRFGSGLTGLYDRIAALDGQLEINSEPGAGTQLIAEVPLPGQVLQR